jgi:ABC-type lipoprotein export system ATPase subunit
MTRPAGLAVRCEELVHIYRTGDLDVVAVRGVDLVIEPGERVALLGPSGSGKSTLLGMLGGLIPASAGQVWIGDTSLGGLSESALLRLRSQRVGFVLQGAARNLLPYGTPVDNIRFAHRSVPRGRRRALIEPHELLDSLGLSAVADRPIPLLAGGEQQRVALAVAVANGPGLLLADEPTSQLDHEGREAVLDLLDVVNERFGTTIVVVTHDAEVGARLGRAVSLRYGRIGLEEEADEDFVVIGRDGSVHLPDDLFAEWPAGTQVVVEREGDSVRLRRRGAP